MTTQTNRLPAHPLLDTVNREFGFKNDAALARELDMAPPHISKVRNQHLPVGADMMIRLHERTQMSIASIKKLAGIPRYDEKQ
jgi:plasmid maintenance system antidote protein VapI